MRFEVEDESEEDERLGHPSFFVQVEVYSEIAAKLKGRGEVYPTIYHGRMAPPISERAFRAWLCKAFFDWVERDGQWRYRDVSLPKSFRVLRSQAWQEGRGWKLLCRCTLWSENTLQITKVGNVSRGVPNSPSGFLDYWFLANKRINADLSRPFVLNLAPQFDIR